MMLQNRLFTLLYIISAVILMAMISAEAAFLDKTYIFNQALGDGEAAWGDFDNDGYVDLASEAKLWKNNNGTNFTFHLDYGMKGRQRACWADFDNDGDLDFASLSNNKSTNYVHRNTGTGFFVDEALPTLPSEGIGDVMSCSWADHDGDGFVDLHITGFLPGTQPDVRLGNNSGSSFSIRWQQTSDLAAGRGVSSCDFDKDADMDIYVSNYLLRKNFLWRNDGAASFIDVADTTHNATAGNGHSIGAAWGDIDNDGLFDLFAGNFSHSDQPQSVFLQNSGVRYDYAFTNKGQCGIAWVESFASPALGDYDNDGDLDLYFSAVGGDSYPGQTSVLYRNNGNWSFSDVTSTEGLSGLDGYQAAWADFDNDGDLDLVTDGKLFENQGNSNRWLRVRLQGNGSNVNSSAIGAQARIRLKDEVLTRQVEGGTGQGNQNDMILHFGLGDHVGPVDIKILWPNGARQMAYDVFPNQTIAVAQGLSGFELLDEFDGAVGSPIDPSQWTYYEPVTGDIIQEDHHLRMNQGSKIATIGQWNPEGDEAGSIVCGYPSGESKDVEISGQYTVQNTAPRFRIGARNSGTQGTPWRGLWAELRLQTGSAAPWIEFTSSGLANNIYCSYNWNDSGTSSGNYTVVKTESASAFAGGAVSGALFDFTVTDRIDGYTFKLEYVSGLDSSHDGTWIKYDITFNESHNNCDDGCPYNHVVFAAQQGNLLLDEILIRLPEPGGIQPISCRQAMDAGYGSEYDFNEDCYVDIADLAELVSQWCYCTDPNNPSCDDPWWH